MPILRLLLAAAVAVAALVAGLFAAIVVAVTALIGLTILRITGRKIAPQSSAARPRAKSRGEAIDVEATEVSVPADKLPPGM